ncbi:hypothetical protein C9374_005341 [Naegleria lovaniensis]|uniref:Transporter n=1 Tax=Naegleria lovaniensis TaxID=51637 RepID=A0AA88GJI5_NAELO|nr:uncharacterized protein C9374_005341 [Naegleria lovaniensis]KAG2382139.1 hypothetical protein C9374_005341 [Naegleria lovaniensis]
MSFPSSHHSNPGREEEDHNLDMSHHHNVIIRHHHHQQQDNEHVDRKLTDPTDEEESSIMMMITSESVNDFDESSHMMTTTHHHDNHHSTTKHIPSPIVTKFGDHQEEAHHPMRSESTTIAEPLPSHETRPQQYFSSSTSPPLLESHSNHTSRQAWGSRISFILASLGAAIGFGSFVRFPYLAYKNGGGAFLIPYTISLVALGIPLLILELSVGQMLRRAAIKANGLLNHRARGIGIAAVIFGGFGICSYYSVLISWIFVYFYHMWAWTLPWKGRAEEYFFETIIRKSPSDTIVTEMNVPILISLLLVWIFVYFGVWKGTSSTGVITYLTVPLPIILLLIMLITSFFLEGSFSGMWYFIKPDFSKLLNVDIWLSAAGQIFFSLSLASGTMIALSSYNDPKQNIVKDAWIIGVSTYLFSIFSGFCMFAILGYMAHTKGLHVDEVVQGGLALAFVVVPESISLMPLPHLFCILFLLSMFTLSIDSCFGMIEGVNGTIHDAFPKLKMHWISLGTCALGFLTGIPYCLDNGYYLMDIVDHYISDFCLVFTAIAQCVLIGYLIANESLWSKVKQQWKASSYSSIEETSVDSPGGYDTNENPIAPPTIDSLDASAVRTERNRRLKNKLRKYWNIFSIILFHSVDEYRVKIKAICKLGPNRDWSILIKFVNPIILLILFSIQLVKEFITPYSTKPHGSTEFDWLSLTIGLCIIVFYFAITIFFAIFPKLAKQKSEIDGNTWQLELERHEKEDAEKEKANQMLEAQQTRDTEQTEPKEGTLDVNGNSTEERFEDVELSTRL